MYFKTLYKQSESLLSFALGRASSVSVKRNESRALLPCCNLDVGLKAKADHREAG